MKCPELGPEVNNNPHYQMGSSISPRKARPGNKITYVVVIYRSRIGGGAGGPHVSGTGVPYVFYCTNSVGCTVNCKRSA